MSKPGYPRALPDTEAQAVLRNLRVSPRKLNLVAAMIRGLPAPQAIATLTFSKRRIAQQVKKSLESAIANAENNHQLDVDRLVVSIAEVGRSTVMRRFHARVPVRLRGQDGRFLVDLHGIGIDQRATDMLRQIQRRGGLAARGGACNKHGVAFH